jgi:hypothetical protein
MQGHEFEFGSHLHCCSHCATDAAFAFEAMHLLNAAPHASVPVVAGGVVVVCAGADDALDAGVVGLVSLDELLSPLLLCLLLEELGAAGAAVHPLTTWIPVSTAIADRTRESFFMDMASWGLAPESSTATAGPTTRLP